jgi:DNA helicase-2/ATP-dependent DNA helicase PcrA
VLFRAAHHSAQLEIELTRRRIPFVKFGGLRFLEAAHVKDLLAMLRWAQNGRDRVSGFRALQLLSGVGPKTAARLLDEVAAAAPGARLRDRTVPQGLTFAWSTFAECIEAVASNATPWPAAFERLCDWYEAEMDRLYEDAAVRRADVRQLLAIAATYAGRERFLTELTLDPPAAVSDEAGVPLRDEDYLILSTIHSAKGQEWTAVSLLNAVDGCLPSDLATGSPAEIEEERRLLYVAMTRAKDHLDILLPQRFYVTQQPALGERYVHAVRSRFIPDALLDRFERLAWPQAPAATEAGTQSRQAAVDLAARMRAMWG